MHVPSLAGQGAAVKAVCPPGGAVAVTVTHAARVGAEPCRAGVAGQGRYGGAGDGAALGPAERLLLRRQPDFWNCGPKALGFAVLPGASRSPRRRPARRHPVPRPRGRDGAYTGRVLPPEIRPPGSPCPSRPSGASLGPRHSRAGPEEGQRRGGRGLPPCRPGERRARLCRAPNRGHGAARRAGGRSGSEGGDCHPKRAGRPGAGQRGRRLARGRAGARAAAAWEARAGRGLAAPPRGARRERSRRPGQSAAAGVR